MRTVNWFIFSALITASILATASTSVAQEVSSPPSTNALALSVGQLKTINECLAALGRQNNWLAATKKLSLSSNDIRQYSLRDKKTGDIHVYSKTSKDEMVFTFVDIKTQYNYRVDTNLNLIASVAISVATTDRIPSDIPNPELGLHAELVYWGHIAKQIDDLDPSERLSFFKPNSSSTTNSPPK